MTIITLKCDEASSESLRSYLDRHKISGKDEFHSTLLYSEVRPCYDRPDLRDSVEAYFPLILNPNTYSLDIFNSSLLVLRFDDERFRYLKAMLSAEQSTQFREGPQSEEELRILQSHLPHRKSQIFNDSFPHITLAKGYRRAIEDLERFEEPLTFSDLDWYHQEHL